MPRTAMPGGLPGCARISPCSTSCASITSGGFESYWSIPAETATVQAPADGCPAREPDFFRAVKTALPNAKLIAEDLGVLTPDVVALREATGLPGMAVLQFAFGGGADNLYLPHNHRANSVVVIPATTDNDNDVAAGTRLRMRRPSDHVRRYLRVDGRDISGRFPALVAYASVCNLAVIPLQDLLGLGSAARFNSPGQPEGNWAWRFASESEQLSPCSPSARALISANFRCELYRR